MYNLLAKFLAIPAVTNWLIKRAVKTPYLHIPNRTGTATYMERYWLFNPYDKATGWLRKRLPSIRLHHILLPDEDEHLHDHPWDARTFILKGWYDEQRLDNEEDRLYRNYNIAGDTLPVKYGEYHRIFAISEGGAWTMFVTFKYQGSWGFLVKGKKVNWREYLGVKK